MSRGQTMGPTVPVGVFVAVGVAVMVGNAVVNQLQITLANGPVKDLCNGFGGCSGLPAEYWVAIFGTVGLATIAIGYLARHQTKEHDTK